MQQILYKISTKSHDAEIGLKYYNPANRVIKNNPFVSQEMIY